MDSPSQKVNTYPRLEYWSMEYSYVLPNKAPEEQPRYLTGIVYGHPKFADGHKINTSYIQYLDSESSDNLLAVCDSRIYALGMIDPYYEEFVAKHKESRNTKDSIFEE